MSLTSKENELYNIDYLALDFGLYPDSNNLQLWLTEKQQRNINNNENIIIMDLNTSLMSTSEWDVVLDNILLAKRCITL